MASERGVVTKISLEEELSQRVQGLLFVEKQGTRGIKDLIRELRDFGWLYSPGGSSKSLEVASFQLSPEGEAAFELFKQNKKEFRRLLTTKMQAQYIVPGWFVNRLWALNPTRQGETVVPAPPRGWNPDSREWADNSWTPELEIRATESLQVIQRLCPGSFPMCEGEWIASLIAAWNRLGSMKQRRVAKPSGRMTGKEKEQMKTYAPRRRLALAMREAAVRYLFSNSPPYSDLEDFGVSKQPLLPRTYMAWCPRLAALELIFYTDVHPLIPGRLIFPTSVFRASAPQVAFEKLETIKNPKGESLWLHQPTWESTRQQFYKILSQEHQRTSARVGSMYVSLLDVRDEVCRQLRLSADCFDSFLEQALRESLQPNSKWSISVETDIREDQRSGSQLIRRPVWISGVPHSLIALTEIRDG